MALEQAADADKASVLHSALAQQAASGVPWSYSATIAGNHDLDRLAARLSDTDQRAVAALLMTLPGTPYIYYGDELGTKMGLKAGDEAKRTPMAWDPSESAGFTDGTPWVPLAPGSATRNVHTELADPTSLLQTYRGLIRLRKSLPALRSNQLAAVALDESAVVALLRWSNEEAALVLVNLSEAPVQPGTANLAALPQPDSEAAFADDWPTEPQIRWGGAGTLRWSDPANADLGPALEAGEARVITWPLEGTPGQ